MGVTSNVSQSPDSLQRAVESNVVSYRELELYCEPADPSLTCSRTSSLGDRSSCTKRGTAPFSITSRVLSDVPEATLVNAQAASNCENRRKNVTYSQQDLKATYSTKGAYLKLRGILTLQELYKARDDSLADDLFDRRVSFCMADTVALISLCGFEKKRQLVDPCAQCSYLWTRAF